jgi:hypothetical protein
MTFVTSDLSVSIDGFSSRPDSPAGESSIGESTMEA